MAYLSARRFRSALFEIGNIDERYAIVGAALPTLKYPPAKPTARIAASYRVSDIIAASAR